MEESKSTGSAPEETPPAENVETQSKSAADIAVTDLEPADASEPSPVAPEEETKDISEVYERSEYAKPDFWNDRFRE
jgi:hypothetical protein